MFLGKSKKTTIMFVSERREQKARRKGVKSKLIMMYPDEEEKQEPLENLFGDNLRMGETTMQVQ